MVGLVYNQEPYGIKGVLGELALTHRLDQGDDKVLLHVKHVTLYSTDGCTWAKGLDTVSPLVRQELLVNYNHCTDL